MDTIQKTGFIPEILRQFGGDMARAIAHLRAGIAESPVDMRLNLQVLLNVGGDEAGAFAISDELLKLAPQDPRVLFNRGWHLLHRGRFPEGFALLEHGRMLRTYGHPPVGSIRPLWSPTQSRPGETVLVNLEGGLGDEIIHFRFVRALARDFGLRVVVACSPSLASAFHRMPEVSAVAQREACLGVYHDWWLPAMSLPLLLNIEAHSIPKQPYLKAEPARTQKWKRLVANAAQGKFKIGIRWAGNPEFEHQQLRKFPPELLLSISELKEVQLYSFQRDHDLVNLPAEILDLAPFITDWDDTMAFAENMDLMITSCTSVAHMSAAMGLNTWVIVPVLSYFIWATPGSESPWYATAKVFRQSQFGHWESVRQDIRQAVEVWVSAKKKASA